MHVKGSWGFPRVFFFIGENKNCKEQRSNVGAWRVKLGNFLGIVL